MNPADLDALAKSLTAIVAAIKAGGWILVVVLFIFATWKITESILKARKATQSVTVQVGDKEKSGGSRCIPDGKFCLIEDKINRLDSFSDGVVRVHDGQTRDLKDLKEGSGKHVEILSEMNQKLGALVMMEKIRNGFPKDADLKDIMGDLNL